MKLHDLGDGKKAYMAFLEAADQDPKLVAPYLFLASYSQSSEDFITYLAKAKENLATASEWEKLYFAYLQTNLKAEYNKRLKIAQKIVDLAPDKARSYVLLGDAYADLHDVTKAREAYHKASTIEPAWPGSYTMLINSYLFQEPKDLEQAETLSHKLVQLAPASVMSHVTLGDVYRAQNKLPEAEGAYTRALQIEPTSPAMYYKRAHINSFLGRYDQARADYETASTLDHSPVSGRLNFALTYVYAGQPKKAVQLLLKDGDECARNMERAKAVSAQNVYLHNAALIAAHMQDPQSLRQVIKKIKPVCDEMARQYDSDEARRDVQAGVMLQEMMLKTLHKNYAGAKQQAEDMKALMAPINSPFKDQDYNYIQGYIALHQKDYATAISHLELLNKEDIYGQYMLAKAYEGKGEQEKATAIYQKLANYNSNVVAYALIRNELKDKM
jgi:tetratricopeptide (TPR) repeat protein